MLFSLTIFYHPRTHSLRHVLTVYPYLHVCTCRVFRVRADDSSVPLRDARGFCVPAAFNEVGLIMNVVNNDVVERRFDGYSDSAASKSKLLHDVLRKGDCYFNSGDLLSRSSDGFYYW